MKVILAVLVILPLAFAIPDKRLLLGTLFPGDELKSLVTLLVTLAGSEETEHKCEMECHSLVQHNNLLQHGCPLVCRSLQSLAHGYGIPHPSKRLLLLDTLFEENELKSLVSTLVSLAGSNETEHKCEMECHALVQQNHLLQHGCPLVCRSLQSLAHRFGIPHPSSHSKRILIDSLFQGDELKSLVTQLVATAGSNETEHKCETACHSLVQHNNLLQFACPLVCKSLQSLAHRFGIQHPSKRTLLDTLFQGDELKSLVTQLVAKAGSDETEHQCEMACHSLVQHNNLLQFACPLVCKSLQSLAHRFGIQHPSKRTLLDTLFQGDELKSLVTQLVAKAGSDETEHQCEMACHSLVQHNNLLQFACPLVCKSLQSLAHRFGIQHPSKRTLLDTLFQGDELKSLVTQLVAKAGSDETEHQCEMACHSLVQHNNLLQFACPLVCKSLQSLAHRFGIQHPSKRTLLDTLFQGDELKSLVTQLVAKAGSDETEHQCEMTCHSLVQHNNLLQFACPLVCKSLQSLAHRFGIQHPSKRTLLDTLFQGDELKSLVTQLVAKAGSDETEHQCEMTCHSLVQHNNLLQFACPLVCKSLQSLAHRFGIQHPSKRTLLDTLFQGDELKSLVTQLVAKAGSDETEHQCEMTCHSLVQHNNLLQFACPLVCKSLQSLAHRFGIQHPSKRTLLDTLFQGDELKSLVTQLVAKAGSDETEHQCEMTCHSLVQHNNLLQFACPLVCKSLQSLAHRFGIQHPSKRILLDSFQGGELKSLVTKLVALAGSDETEHQCETACHSLVQHNNLLQFACPLVCKSLQSLAQGFGIPHQSTDAKRLLLDTLFQGDELKSLVSTLVALAGSEETEHKCETECHSLVQQNHLLQHGCPLICRSLQSLAHSYGISHPNVVPQKRLLLNTLLQGVDLKVLLTQMASTLASDSTEIACESQCHHLIQTDHLLQFGCPLICKSFQSLVLRFGIHAPVVNMHSTTATPTTATPTTPTTATPTTPTTMTS